MNGRGEYDRRIIDIQIQIPNVIGAPFQRAQQLFDQWHQQL